MKYNYRFHVLRHLTLLVLLATAGVNGINAQGLSTNKTYVVNGQSDLVAPVDTFYNLTGSSTGPQYGALSYLNQFGMNSIQSVTGQVIFLLSAGYNPVEPNMINIGQTTGAGGWPNMYWNANSPIIIKPALGQNFEITTSVTIGANQSLVRFNGAWYAHIDGEGIPGQRNLTFKMPSTATQTSSRIVDILPTSGQRIQSVSVKSCNLVGNSTSIAPNTYAGVYFGGAGAGSPTALGQNQNIDISNNYIIAVQNGIYLRGIANTVNLQNKNVTVNNNTIGDYTNTWFPANTAAIGGLSAAGIYVNAVANASVSNNTIRNTVLNSPNFKGIFLTSEGGAPGMSLDSNIQVNGNRIYNLNCTASGGLTGIRMNLGSHGQHLRILISNNMISKLTATNGQPNISTFAYPVGILIEDVSNNVGAEVYFNSVYLSGSTIAAGGFSACFGTAGGVTGGVILMNNSFANTMGRQTTNLIGYTNYNVLTISGLSPFLYSSFNNYYANTLDGGTSFIARYRNVDYTSLKGYAMNNRSDSTSYSTIPPFKNDSDLTVNSGVSHRTFNSGANLTQFFSFYPNIFDSIRFKINTDIDGASRSGFGRFTSIGCDLWAGDSSNNNIALLGNKVFPINGSTVWPTASNSNGSFATICDAVEYLNHYGTGGSGDVVLQLQAGYPGESRYIPMLIDYPGSNLGRPVIFRSQTGYVANVTQPNNNAMNNQALLRFTGANWVSFNGGTNRGIRFSMPPNATNTNTRVISITPYDTASNNIGILNCVITGNSNTNAPNTTFGIYLGGHTISFTPLPALKGANDNITISGNEIQAVRTGMVLFAPGLSFNNLIKSNIVGGTIPPGTAANTTYIGGSANQSGIWVKGMVDIFIDSNVVRNCVPTGNASNAFYGIFADETGSTAFSGVNITRNFIYNLVTSAGNGCAGIRVSLSSGTAARGIRIFNNFIGRILGNGTGVNFNNLNPAGISIDASAAQTTAGIALAHNTVHLSGTGLGLAGSGSAALYIGAAIQGGVESDNNIFGNRINRTSATGNRYAVLVGHTASPFNTSAVLPFGSNNNNYFATGNGTNYVGANSGGTQNRANINNWRAFTAATPALAGMDGNSFNWVNTFKNDTTPDIELLYAGPVPGGASIVTGICTDIYGNARYLCPGGSPTITRWVGASESGLPYPALQGNVTYPINGVDDPPTPARPNSGTFKTVRRAVDYLNSQGVDDPNFGGFRTIRLEIQSGYVGETDTFMQPITVLDYPRQASTRPVVLTLASGRNDTIKIVSTVNPAIASNQSLFRFSGCKYFSIDGNNGSGGRNLTLLLPAAFNTNTNRVVDIIGGIAPIMATDAYTQNNGVKNCNIMGISSTSSIATFAGVYEGGLTAASNSLIGQNNGTVIQNNFIGAVQFGVYLRSDGQTANMDYGVQVIGNTIGGNVAPNTTGNTDYFGGVANAAGIWVQSQTGFNISGNTIRNSMTNFGAPRGIELATTAVTAPVLSSDGDINGNVITNIRTTVAGGAYGIYLNFGSDNSNVNREITISNNMISAIASPGSAASSTFANNPYGIYFNANTNIGGSGNTFVGIYLYYNSINLGQANTMAVGNSISACVGIPSFIRSGVYNMNNIYQNRLSANGIQNYVAGIAIGGTTSPFYISNYNSYFTAAASPAILGNVIGNASTTSPAAYNPWFEIMNFTGQDTLSITSQAPFTSDVNLFIPGSTNSNLYQAGKPISGLPTDISGNARNIFQPSIGAHEFSGTYLDNIAPRIFNMTDPTSCQSGNILLDFNIYDKLLVADSLYYRINGGTVQNTQAIISAGTFRRFVIPAQASGTLIEFRLTAIDYPTPPNTGVYPAGKLWDTLSTGITNFPYTNGWEGLNNPAWASQTITNNAQWEMGVLGSSTNPPLGARTGIRSALFRASSLPVGASARLVSPCLDFSNLTSPTLRFYISQNSDLPAKRDSIQVKVSFGGNIWSNALRSVERVNTNFPLPGYRVIEVCLAAYQTSGLRVAIEGYSSGTGQNIQIDDIEIFDDVQTQSFTPSVFSHCLRDSVRLNLPGSDARFIYRAVNMATGQTLATKDGDGSNTWIGFMSPVVDTLKVFVEASNITSMAINTGFGGGFITCRNHMPDSVTIRVNRFYNGPFITAGLPFNGSFNAGDGNNPDGARAADTITYRFVTPAFYTNADYGSLWSIPSITAFRQASGIPFTGYTFVPPSGLNYGYVRVIAPIDLVDSNIVFRFTIRINASNCDSIFDRVLRVIGQPPVANFTYTPPSTNLCANNSIFFNALGSTKPANNFPFTYTWIFGDGSLAFVENPTKVYANPGNYTVRFVLTDRYGISSEKVENITVLPSPTVLFTTNVPCALDSTVFTPNTQPAGSIYRWTMPNSTIQTREVAKYWFNKYDTAYDVTLRITNSSGCFIDLKKNIYVFAKPIANWSTNPHCLSTNVPITNTSTIPVGVMGYNWEWGNGQTSLSATPTYKYPVSGTYTAKLRVSSAFGCIDTMVKIITVYDRPFAGFTVANPCFGENDVTVFNNTTNFAGGLSSVNFNWTFGDTKSSSDQSPSNQYRGTGVYVVHMKAADKINGCRDSITRNVAISYKPVAQFATSPETGICVNNELTVINTSYTIDQVSQRCDWTWGDGGSDTICATNHTYTNHGLYSITLITSTAAGCSDTAIKEMEVRDPPIQLLSCVNNVDSGSYPHGENSKVLISNITDAEYWNWQMGDAGGSTRNGNPATFVFSTRGTYWVKCTVKDLNGCMMKDSIQVVITASVGVQDDLAAQFDLNAFPNPFNNATTLGFELPKSANVKVSVQDMLGRTLRTYNLGQLNAGKHQQILDEFGAAGSYLIRTEIDGVLVYKQVIKN